MVVSVGTGVSVSRGVGVGTRIRVAVSVILGSGVSLGTLSVAVGMYKVGVAVKFTIPNIGVEEDCRSTVVGEFLTRTANNESPIARLAESETPTAWRTSGWRFCGRVSASSASTPMRCPTATGASSTARRSASASTTGR